MSSVLLLIAGLAGLLIGAELLVRGGSNLAIRLGVTPIVIGLTVVSIGTSMPELAIGIDAARQGSPGLAVGNIVGTNLVNLLLILGISALIRPISLDSRILRFDLPAMTAASVLVFIMARDGFLDRVEGVVLFLASVGYTLVILRTSRKDSAQLRAESSTDNAAPETADHASRPVLDLIYLLGGIAVIVVGADLLVDGAATAARSLGVSDAIVGLTIVAIGTSAPEFVTTLLSTLRGDRDIALGNLLGSSVYNLALILGLTILFAPAVVEVPAEVLDGDLVLMAVGAIASVPVFLSGRRINRVEGGVFVAAYGVYLAWLLIARA